MQIGTDYAQISGLTTLFGAGSSRPAGTSSGVSSLFGPAALLSLGSGSAGASGGYSQLGAGTGPQAGVPQFDLAGIFAAKSDAAAAPRVSPKMQREERQTLQMVAGLVDQARYDEARELIGGLRKKNPRSGPAVHALGVVEFKQRNYEKAERLFHQAHHLSPQRGYHEDAEVAHYLQKDDADVLAAARRMTGASDTRAQGTRLLVGLTRRNPLHTEARMLLAENLLKQRDAVNGLAQYRLAILTADQGHLEQIESRLSELVEIAPKAAYLRRLLGQTQLRLGQHEQAAQTLATATELANGDPVYRAEEAPAHLAIGREKLSRHDIAGALASFEWARSLDFSSPEVKVALGEAYLARGEQRTRIGSLSAAIGDFKTAAGKLRSHGDDALRRQLARAAFAAGVLLDSQHQRNGERVGDESVAYQTAYDMDPDNAAYRSKWAEISNRIGDEFLADENYKDAAYAYQRARELYRGNQTYRTNTINAFTLYGDEQMDHHEFSNAIDAYRTAYNIDHADASRLKLASAYNARGEEYLDEGDLTRARADFRRALYYDPENTTYQENYNFAAG